MRIFVTVLLCSICNVAAAMDKILVYSGPGVGAQSLTNTVQTIRDLVADKYEIMTIGSKTLIGNDWQAGTTLLVIPGGADLPYVDQLHGAGTANIRNYVAGGGKFLGICAGAYFSAAAIEFAKGDPKLEVTGSRELKFFPGLVAGPTFTGFDHRDPQNVAGTRAANIYWQLDSPFMRDTKFTVYYNGGGHFVDAKQFDNITVLARYDTHAAIVEAKVGAGIAILSGPHFEQDPHLLDTHIAHLSDIKQKLLNTNEQRLALTKHLLQRLDLELKH